jgi:predicted NBD/HSP70 family sugar kinase
MKASYAEMEARAENRHERFIATLDGSKTYGKGTTTCQIETTSSSEKMKANQAEMEAKAAARQEEAAARQAKADAQADAHLERIKAIMRSIPSEIDKILQQKVEA